MIITSPFTTLLISGWIFKNLLKIITTRWLSFNNFLIKFNFSSLMLINMVNECLSSMGLGSLEKVRDKLKLKSLLKEMPIINDWLCFE